MRVKLALRVDFRNPERDQLCLHPEKVQTQEQGGIALRCYLGVAYLLHKNYSLTLLALEQNASELSSTLHACDSLRLAGSVSGLENAETPGSLRGTRLALYP